MKVSLIQHSKSGGVTPIRNFKSSGISFRKNGTIRVGMPKNFTTYGNLWDFEHLYLEPSIKKLKHSIHCLKDGIDRKKRYGRMMLSGRLDAECGNFMIHYDPKTHILSYRGFLPSKHYEPVGRVLFSSGQDLVDQATAHTGVPVGWSVVDLGNAWRFDACLTLLYDEDPESNNGWICMDINSGHLAVVETDSMGCPRSRKVIQFSQNRSQEDNTRAASEALELVFRLCLETGKPLAAEDIGKVNRKASRYSKEQKRNRSVSLFPSSKLLELIESKARKYGIGLKLVNPAYTSQIGKMKYMRHDGMSIHESAALAIGRRAAGFQEKLPREYRSPSTKRWKQWKAAYPVMKKIKPADLYVMKPAS